MHLSVICCFEGYDDYYISSFCLSCGFVDVETSSYIKTCFQKSLGAKKIFWSFSNNTVISVIVEWQILKRQFGDSQEYLLKGFECHSKLIFSF